MCVCVHTSSDCGLWDLLLIDAYVQRPLAQLLQVAGGGPAEALQRQTHVLLSNEESLHHTLGSVQQIREGNLREGRWRVKRKETETGHVLFI